MPKKEWTPEERKAFGDKMRALKAAKAQEKAKAPKEVHSIEETPTEVGSSAPVPETIDQGDDINQMKRQIKELSDALFLQNRVAQAPQGAQITPQGILGTRTKFSVNPKNYPNPIDRLFEESKLKLKDFNRNWWDLDWSVTAARYQEKDGVWSEEPKFQLKLIRIIEHPDTGEPSNRRYVLHKATFFEDPSAAIALAHEYGMEVPEELHKDFLDEMRYLRIRDWVLESFYPPKPSQDKLNKKEEVIGNRLVEVFEINSTQAEAVPFKDLKRKW